MDIKSGPKPVLKILFLEDSPLDAELIKECLLENFGPEIQIDAVANEKDYIWVLCFGHRGPFFGSQRRLLQNDQILQRGFTLHEYQRFGIG